MKKLQSKTFFLVFVYFVVLLSVRSTYVIEAFPALESVSKYSTVLTYLPFLVAILWKFIADVCQLKRSVSSVSNCIYYAFLLYYVAVSAYRLTHGMEVKENLYYTIVFLGSVAAYMLLRDGRIFMSKKDLEKNLLWIATLFILFRLAYVLIGAQYFTKAPINLNLTSGAVAVLLPVIGNMLTESKLEKKKSIFPWIVFCASVIVIATTGARALFALLIVTVVALLLVALIKRTGVLRLISAFALACVIVLGLAAADVGDVRYALYRQTGIDFSTSLNIGGVTTSQTTVPNTTVAATDAPAATQATNVPDATTATKLPANPVATKKPDAEPTKKPDAEPTKKPGAEPTKKPNAEPTKKPEAEPTKQPAATTQDNTNVVTDEDQLKAQKQINASDRMRKKLVEYGMKQIEANPIFGTGDVMYEYRLNKDYVFMQSSHNFLIEAIICYGLVGLALIVALIIAMLLEMKLFAKPMRYRWSYRIALLLTMVVYFAFGFVQPTVFDSLICPLFILAVATCRKALQEAQ